MALGAVRRVFLLSLAALNELTKYVYEQSRTDPPAHLTSLSTFLIAVAAVLGEWLERSRVDD